MKIEEAFRLIENLDYPDGLNRKFSPGFSLLQIARTGEIACVERYKARPTETEQIEMLDRHPGTIQISGIPGLYVSSEELRQRVIDSMWLFEHMKIVGKKGDGGSFELPGC